MSASTNLATQAGSQSSTLKGLLKDDRVRRQLAAALPKHLTQERFVRVALTTLSRTPDLALCDQNSFFNALLDLSSLGIEPDNRKAYLIPFKNRRKEIVECQLIISYVGLLDLVRRSGEVDSIHCDVVCENDECRYGIKDGKLFFDWVPARRERGEVIGAFSVVVMKSGGLEWEYMTREQIETVRNDSQGKNASPWTKHWDEMARKTVFRRHAKRLPFSVEIQDAIEKDDKHLFNFGEGAIDVDSEPLPTTPIDPFQAGDSETQSNETKQGPESEPDQREEKSQPAAVQGDLM